MNNYIDNVVPVVIGNSFNAYGVVRSFADEGLSPIVVECGGKSFVGKSKYKLARYVVSSPASGVEKFVRDLIRIGKEIAPQRGMLFPTHDEQLLAIATNKDSLCEYYEIPFSDYEVLKKIMDKACFREICERLGIPTIKEVTVASVEEACKGISGLNYPVIIKDLIFDGSSQRKHTTYCQTQEEYIKAIKEIYLSNPNSKLIVQEYIEDNGHLMPNVNSFSDREGKLQCVFVSEKQRQYPPNTGTSTATLVADASQYKDIIDYSYKLIKELGFYGLFGIEYKYDERDSSYKVIEMNPRSEFPNYLQTMVGQNMPYNLYRYHLGKDTKIDFYSCCTIASCIVPFSDYFDSVILNRINQKKFSLNCKQWKESIVKPSTKYGVSKKDLLPLLGAYVAEMKKGIASYIRIRNHIPNTISIGEYYRTRKASQHQ